MGAAGHSDPVVTTREHLHALCAAQERRTVTRHHERRHVLISAPAAIIVFDTGATEHIHPNQADLINTRPSNVTFIGLSGEAADASVVGDLPLVLTDAAGREFPFLLRGVHAAASFKFTLVAWGPLEELEGAVHLQSGDRWMRLPPNEHGARHTVVPEFREKLYVLRGRVGAPPERRVGRGLAAYHHPHTRHHLTSFDPVDLAEAFFRRLPVGTRKLRALPRTSSDAPATLARCAEKTGVPDEAWAVANANKVTPPRKRVGSETHLDAAGPFPVRSKSGFVYFWLFIDAYSALVLPGFSSDVSAATLVRLAHQYRTRLRHLARGITFEEPENENLKELLRASVARLEHFHADKAGAVLSDLFDESLIENDAGLTKAPRDAHDLNGRPERVIRVILEVVRYMLLRSGAPTYLWEYAVTLAALVVNSTCDERIRNRSPLEIVTGDQPQILNILPFGCAAVITKPEKDRGGKLRPRGALGVFLGSDPETLGGYFVYLLESKSIVSTCDIRVDEFAFPLAPSPPDDIFLRVLRRATAKRVSSPALAAKARPWNGHRPGRGEQKLTLYIFSGPYARPDSLAAHLELYENCGECINIDSAEDPEHDIFIDAFLEERILGPIAAGMVANVVMSPNCTYYSVAREYNKGNDDGPPPLFSLQYPDGVPESSLPPRHVAEQRRANAERERVVEILDLAITHNVNIILEHPAPRCVDLKLRGQWDENGKGAGSLFITSEFRKLAARGLRFVTFAQCVLSAHIQKYTTIAYLGEVGKVLRQLDRLECPHIDHAKRASGRDTEGNWRSKEHSAWPPRLNAIIAYAIASQHHANPPHFTERARLILAHDWREPTHIAPRSHVSAVAGPWNQLAVRLPPADEVTYETAPTAPRQPPKPLPIQGQAERAVRSSVAEARIIAVAHAVERLDSSTFVTGDDLRPARRICVPAAVANGDRSVPLPAQRNGSQCTSVAEHHGVVGHPAGSTPDPSVGDVSSTPGRLRRCSDSVFPVNAALDRGLTPASGAIVKFGHPRPGLHILAARTSAGPRDPSGHGQAMRQDAQRGDAAWFTAELEELGNHSGKADDPRFVERFIRGQCTMEECVEAGSTWCYVTYAEARRIALQHGKEFTTTRATWVYKTKRNGKHKARCCLDGSSQRFGENYNQTFCSTLRMPSLRLLLNVAARRGLKARRRDLVAAFLQGVLEDGEIAFMHQPAGHANALDENGRPKLCLILKPLYGMKQAGRRFQRAFFAWLERPRDEGGAGLIPSKEDPCIYRITTEDDELIIGVYVDDLIIFYSATPSTTPRGLLSPTRSTRSSFATSTPRGNLRTRARSPTSSTSRSPHSPRAVFTSGRGRTCASSSTSTSTRSSPSSRTRPSRAPVTPTTRRSPSASQSEFKRPRTTPARGSCASSASSRAASGLFSTSSRTRAPTSRSPSASSAGPWRSPHPLCSRRCTASCATSASTLTLVLPTTVGASRPPTTSSTPSATPTGRPVDPRLAGSSACGAPRLTGGFNSNPPSPSLPARPRSCPPRRRPRTSSSTGVCRRRSTRSPMAPRARRRSFTSTIRPPSPLLTTRSTMASSSTSSDATSTSARPSRRTASASPSCVATPTSPTSSRSRSSPNGSSSFVTRS